MSSSKRFNLPVAVYLVLRKADKVLLLLRSGTGFCDGQYSLIAGHLDGFEPATTAVIREAKEEANITIKVESLSLGCTVHRKTPEKEYIDIFYECSSWEGQIQNMEPTKCKELQFFEQDSLPENTIQYVKTALECCLNKKQYLEIGWD